MKIALLICDEVNKNLQNIQGDYPDMFKELFPSLHFDVFNVFKGQFPPNAHEYEAYLVNGSRHSVYEDVDWIIHLKEFVEEIYKAKKKYVGVCFGHQLLAEALGGQVARATTGWSVGVHQFEITQKENWMSPFQSRVNLLMMCQDQVKVLPPQSEILAKTPLCPVGMFTVCGHMLGIQAHPEFSKSYDRALMELRIARMGTEVVNTGIESLEKPVDREIVAEWILQFLNYPFPSI